MKERHPILGRLVLAIDPEPDEGWSWSTGAAGEEDFARELASVPEGTVLTLHDRRIPKSKANIDHLAVTPTGVWVIDSKRYRGIVENRDVGGWLRTDVRLFVAGRDRSKLVAGVRAQTERVAEALAEDGAVAPVYGALCFVQAEWRLFAKPFRIDGVHVSGPKSLRTRLLEPGPVDEGQRTAILRLLALCFPPAS